MQCTFYTSDRRMQIKTVLVSHNTHQIGQEHVRSFVLKIVLHVTIDIHFEINAILVVSVNYHKNISQLVDSHRFVPIASRQEVEGIRPIIIIQLVIAFS